MTFVYDIYVNFQSICYDFFEWNKKDKITRIKKIPIFQIDENIFVQILAYDTQIDLQTLECIKNKTEIFKQKNKITAALFTNNKDIIAVLIDDNGKIIKKSFLLLEEENTILQSIRKVDYQHLELTKLKRQKIDLVTRKEKDRTQFLLKELAKMSSLELCYLFFECFGIRETDEKRAKKMLTLEISNGNEEVCVTSYNFLKLICTNH